MHSSSSIARVVKHCFFAVGSWFRYVDWFLTTIRTHTQAYIVFDSPIESRRATHKDRETFGDKFGDRYVRVYPTLDSDLPDMQAAMTQQSTQVTVKGLVVMLSRWPLTFEDRCEFQGNGHSHGHSDSVVKIKSLPFDASQLDVINFFDGFKMKANGVQLVVRSDNKPTGEVRYPLVTLKLNVPSDCYLQLTMQWCLFLQPGLCRFWKPWWSWPSDQREGSQGLLREVWWPLCAPHSGWFQAHSLLRSLPVVDPHPAP